jgi:hypothetical protein
VHTKVDVALHNIGLVTYILMLLLTIYFLAVNNDLKITTKSSNWLVKCYYYNTKYYSIGAYC